APNLSREVSARPGAAGTSPVSTAGLPPAKSVPPQAVAIVELATNFCLTDIVVSGSVSTQKNLPSSVSLADVVTLNGVSEIAQVPVRITVARIVPVEGASVR